MRNTNVLNAAALAGLVFLLLFSCDTLLSGIDPQSSPTPTPTPGSEATASPTAEPTQTPSPSPEATEPSLVSTKLYLAGDSTVADYSGTSSVPQSGWGEKIGSYLYGSVEVKNHAKGGTSTKSFRAEGRWTTILNALQSGDWVMIQFGHNDEKEEYIDRYVDPDTFKANLKTMISEVRAKGAEAIIVTPLQRRKFTSGVYDATTHGVYPDKAKEAASESSATLIDLHALSTTLIQSVGEEGSKEIFNFLDPGEHPNYYYGIQDNTHTNTYGAALVAQLVAKALRQSSSSFAAYVNSSAVDATVPVPTPYPTSAPGSTPSGSGLPIVQWTFDTIKSDNTVEPSIGYLVLSPNSATKDIFEQVEGKVGNAVRFANDAGTSTWNYYKTVTNDTLNLHDGFTIEFWTKLDSLTYATNPIFLEYRNGSTGSETGYKIEFDAANSKVRLRLYDGTGYSVSSSTVLTTGQWYHVAATYENGTAYLFVNGVVEGSGLVSVGSNPGDNLIVGGGSTSSDKNIKGSMDQLSIWDYALDPNLMITRYENPQ